MVASPMSSAAAGYEELVAFPVVVEAVVVEPLRRGPRETTLVRSTGAGEEGPGEDVTHGAPSIPRTERSTAR